ncbi:MAG TPA: hypothetical protein PKA76_11265 [Pirellulaceae bacterium]|nr:hypothetical protein [Pirellulaceae bacterium]
MLGISTKQATEFEQIVSTGVKLDNIATMNHHSAGIDEKVPALWFAPSLFAESR